MKPKLELRGTPALLASATLFAFTSLFVKLASRGYSGLFVSASRFAIGAALCLYVLFRHYGGIKSAKPKYVVLRGLFGSVSMVASYAAISLTGPGLFVSASRFAIGAALCLYALFRHYGGIKSAKPKYVILRGLFGSVSMVASYAAISLTGPGRAVLLSNTYPLFVAVFGALFFGETFKPRTFASIAICSAGAALVMRDGSGASLAGDLLALGSALLAGMAVNYVRRATQYDNPFLVYLSPCLFGLPLFFFAPLPAQAGGTADTLFLVGVGVVAFAAQALMAYGYRTVPAGKGSVTFYLETALTVVLGVVFAGERFTARFGLGLGLILAGLAANNARPISLRRPGGRSPSP